VAVQWIALHELLVGAVSLSLLPPVIPEMTISRSFDGGALDCGSGLILLIRQEMQLTAAGGVLELLSQEPTVTHELPPWCRMTGHRYLSTEEIAPGHWRHLVQKGGGAPGDAAALAADHERARAYHWWLRARSTGPRESTVYARNASWKVGQALSFEEKDAHPSALEVALGAVAAEVVDAFSVQCSQRSVVLDEAEAALKATLHNVLAHLGLEEGDPGVGEVELTLFITSAHSGAALRELFDQALRRCPLFQTFTKACRITSRLVVM
jgi:TusA-related sulfurtransferase